MALWGADACAKQMAGILALHRWPCNALVSSRPPRIHRNRCVAVASKSTGGKKGDKNKQAHKQAIITSNPVLARLIDGPLIMVGISVHARGVAMLTQYVQMHRTKAPGSLPPTHRSTTNGRLLPPCACCLHACMHADVRMPWCEQGDAVMMTATELSSQRIPLNEDTKWLLGVAVISWFLAAVICGDYRCGSKQSSMCGHGAHPLCRCRQVMPGYIPCHPSTHPVSTLNIHQTHDATPWTMYKAMRPHAWAD